jgi:response regulator RpfG family c-di-GMP phosphodiesterase
MSATNPEVPRVRVLFVDDEPNVLDAMRRNLRGVVEVVTAQGAKLGLETVASQAPFAVVVSDLRMPEMDGVEFLRRMHERSPDTVRILLTGQADVPAAIGAVNDGKIFRFLLKPCPPEILKSVLHAAAEQHRLLTAERVLLQQTLRGSIQALADMVAVVHPAVAGRASRVQRLALELAEKLEVEDRWVLEISALVAHLGYVSLPAATVEKLHAGTTLESDENELVDRVPAIAARVVANIPRLEAVRDVLLHQNTRFDGIDSPVKGVRGEAIPIGARLLKVAADFDLLEAQGLRVDAAADRLAGRTGWYDPRLTGALRERCGTGGPATEIAEMNLAEVRIGMVFAGDVHHPDGMLLVARGQEVTENLLDRIRNYWSGFSRSVRVSMVPRSQDSGPARHAA